MLHLVLFMIFVQMKNTFVSFGLPESDEGYFYFCFMRLFVAMPFDYRLSIDKCASFSKEIFLTYFYFVVITKVLINRAFITRFVFIMK